MHTSRTVRLRVAAFVTFSILASAVGGDSVYKCTDAKGAVTFSQRPCGDNAQQVTVKTTAPAPDAEDQIADTQAALEDVTQRLKESRIEDQLRRRERELDSLSVSRDRKMEALERQYADAVASQPKNYALQRSIMARQSAVRSEYDTKISKARRDVARLQSEMYRAR